MKNIFKYDAINCSPKRKKSKKEKEQKIMMNFLNESNDVPYYPIYNKITGSIIASVFLSYLEINFNSQNKICKTDKEIMRDTAFTVNELRSAKKKIRALKFITITREGTPAKTHYSIDWNNYKSEMDKINDL